MTTIQDSILDSVKHMLGIDPEYPVFDSDIIIHTNSALSTLAQLGVGPIDGLDIADNTTKWNALLGDAKYLNNAKTYVYLRVRLIFDPPTSSFAQQSFQDQCKELEWRMQVAAEDGVIFAPAAIPSQQGLSYLYYVTADNDFPESVPVNAVGLDPVTGNIYKKISSSGTSVTTSYLYYITDVIDFPSDAPLNSVGLDPISGTIYRKTSNSESGILSSYLYYVADAIDFPVEAPINSVGLDPISGKVYRKTL